METRRHRALAEIGRRLRLISVSNGFRTDAGAAVFLGEDATLGPDDNAAAIAVAVPQDETIHHGENVGTEVPVEVHAFVKAGIADPLLALERVLGDVKQAIELPDRTLGGALVTNGLVRASVRPAEREEGSEYVGAVVTYVMTIVEGWGSP